MNLSLRSKGSLALARLGLTTRAIGEAVGVDHPRVVRWISGERKPTATQREIIAATYGIAPPLWDETPEKVAPPPEAPPSDDAPTDLPTAAELAARITRQVERSIRELENDPAVTALERDKRLASLTTVVQRLRADDLTPAQIVRAPATRRILDALVAALRPFPEALEAAAKAIEIAEAEGD